MTSSVDVLEQSLIDEFRFEIMNSTTRIRIEEYLLERFDIILDVDYELDFRYHTSTIRIKYLKRK